MASIFDNPDLVKFLMAMRDNPQFAGAKATQDTGMMAVAPDPAEPPPVAASGMMTPQQQAASANSPSTPNDTRLVTNLQSADFYTEGPYAGMTLREQADAQGVTLSAARRERRLNRDEMDVQATVANLGPEATPQEIIDATLLQQGGGVNASGASGATGKKTKGSQSVRQSNQNAAVVASLDEQGVPLVQDLGNGRYGILNTGYGIHQNRGAIESAVGGPYETHGPDAAPGEYQTVSYKEPDGFGVGDFIKLAAVTGLGAGFGSAASGALGLSGAVGGAVSGGVNAGVQGAVTGDFNLKDVGQGALTGGLIGGEGLVSDIPGFGDAYAADNLGGSFIRNTTNDVIRQGITTGDIDVVDALKQGAIGTTIDVGKDLVGDARQTYDGNLIEGVDTVNGLPMNSEDIARLTNTADLYGLLGEEGLLSKFGLDIGYLPTKYLGGALDLVGFGGRPMENVEAPEEWKAQREDAVFQNNADASQAINEQYANGEITYDEALQAQVTLSQQTRADLAQVDESFLRDTARYDERFFDLTTERGDSPLSGIWEKNPFANTSTTPSIGSPSGSGRGERTSAPISTGTPTYDTNFTPEDDPDFRKFMESNPTAEINTDYTGITDEVFELPTTEEKYVATDDGRQLSLGGAVDEQGNEVVLGDGRSSIPEYVSEEELLEGSIGDDTTKLPAEVPYDDRQVTPELPPSTPPPPPPPPPPPGGSSGEAKKIARGVPDADVDSTLFRLARIMKVKDLSEQEQMSIKGIMRELMLRRGDQAVAGDVTAALDERSTRYIEQVATDPRTGEPLTEDPIEVAIAEVLKE